MQATHELVAAPESWAAPRTKMKKPGEWTVAAMRASGLQVRDVRRVVNTQNLLGEPLWRPPAPKGFTDESAAWVDGLAEPSTSPTRLAASLAIPESSRTRSWTKR